MRDLLVLFALLAIPFAIAIWLISGSSSTQAVRSAFVSLVESGWASRLAIGTAVLVTGTALAVGFARRGRSIDAWQAFAMTHDLSHEGQSTLAPQGRICGRIAGRSFELEVVTTRDLHERSYRSHARMRLAVPGAPPDATFVKKLEMPRIARGMARAIRERLGGTSVVASGDDDLDRRFELRGSEPDALRAWLTPERRRALVELVQQPGFALSHGFVQWTARHAPTSLEQLQATLTRLRACAQAL